MWTFRRQPQGPVVLPVSFGTWALRCFTAAGSFHALAFPEAERAAANAAAALCGAVYTDRDALVTALPLPEDTAAEAALVARRTADGFRAALEDRVHTVIAWPWEHLATRVTWEAVRGGRLDDATVGLRLLQVAGVYAIAHREQLETVLGLWRQVAAGVRGDAGADLAAMGADLYRIYRQQLPPPVTPQTDAGAAPAPR